MRNIRNPVFVFTIIYINVVYHFAHFMIVFQMYGLCKNVKTLKYTHGRKLVKEYLTTILTTSELVV